MKKEATFQNEGQSSLPFPLEDATVTISSAEMFALSALAPSLAVLFTNPFDTAKVRLQLQGEMAAQGVSFKGTHNQTYKNSLDCILKTFRYEGIRGLQKGLVPAIFRESSKNVFRIGLYDPILGVIHDASSGTPPPGWKRLFAGGVCGMMGAFSSNPFELIKTRLQSSAKSDIAVGYQFKYSGFFNGLWLIYKEDGLRGLYKGSALSVGRSVVGSGVNLSSYSILREYFLNQRGWKDGIQVDMVSGLVSGALTSFFINPIDVIRTRFYNQPMNDQKQGILYKSGIDAFWKILRKEGPFTFYKGLIAHFLRLGPHFCLTFVFLNMLRRQLAKQREEQCLKEAFSFVDINRNGRIEPDEMLLVLKYLIPYHQTDLVPPKLKQEGTYPDNNIKEGEQEEEEGEHLEEGWSFKDYESTLESYVSSLFSSVEGGDRGFVLHSNLLQLSTLTKQVVREHEMKKAFNRFDKDKSGLIDVSDLKVFFVEQWIHQQAPACNMVEPMDSEHIDLLVQRLLDHADTAKDGVIDYDEFSKLCKKMKSLHTSEIIKEWSKAIGIPSA